MSKLNQRFELAANCLIIVVALILGVVLVQKYFLVSSVPTAPPRSQCARVQPRVGSTIELADVKWGEQPKTLIFALQANCGYCNSSAPFYKQLAEKVQGKNIRLVAVFPTAVADSSAHMAKLGLTGFEVRQASLDSIQTSGTPTLLLTNENGEITNFWVGKLPPDKEAEVIQKLLS